MSSVVSHGTVAWQGGNLQGVKWHNDGAFNAVSLTATNSQFWNTKTAAISSAVTFDAVHHENGTFSAGHLTVGSLYWIGGNLLAGTYSVSQSQFYTNSMLFID